MDPSQYYAQYAQQSNAQYGTAAQQQYPGQTAQPQAQQNYPTSQVQGFAGTTGGTQTYTTNQQGYNATTVNQSYGQQAPYQLPGTAAPAPSSNQPAYGAQQQASTYGAQQQATTYGSAEQRPAYATAQQTASAYGQQGTYGTSTGQQQNYTAGQQHGGAYGATQQQSNTYAGAQGYGSSQSQLGAYSGGTGHGGYSTTQVPGYSSSYGTAAAAGAAAPGAATGSMQQQPQAASTAAGMSGSMVMPMSTATGMTPSALTSQTPYTQQGAPHQQSGQTQFGMQATQQQYGTASTAQAVSKPASQGSYGNYSATPQQVYGQQATGMQGNPIQSQQPKYGQVAGQQYSAQGSAQQQLGYTGSSQQPAAASSSYGHGSRPGTATGSQAGQAPYSTISPTAAAGSTKPQGQYDQYGASGGGASSQQYNTQRPSSFSSYPGSSSVAAKPQAPVMTAASPYQTGSYSTGGLNQNVGAGRTGMGTPMQSAGMGRGAGAGGGMSVTGGAGMSGGMGATGRSGFSGPGRSSTTPMVPLAAAGGYGAGGYIPGMAAGMYGVAGGAGGYGARRMDEGRNEARRMDEGRHEPRRMDEDRGRGGFGDRGRSDRRPPSPRRDRMDAGKRREEPPRRRSRSPPKRRSPSPARRMSPPRRRTPSPPRPRAPDYGVRVPAHTYSQVERDYGELNRRYTHLTVAPDFSKLVCNWAQMAARPADTLGCVTFPLDRYCKFEHETEMLTEDAPAPPAPTSEASAGTPAARYTVRVVLVQGLSAAVRDEVIKGPHHEGGQHLSNALRFIAMRLAKDGDKRGMMAALGGAWDAALDGGEPVRDESALIRAGIRHVKEQAGLDLSPCQQWLRFCEVHYLRSASHDGAREGKGRVSSEVCGEVPEVCVFYLVGADELVASAQDWPDVYRQQVEWKKAKATWEEASKKEDAAKSSKDKDKTPEKAKPEDKREAATKEQAADGAATKPSDGAAVDIRTEGGDDATDSGAAKGDAGELATGGAAGGSDALDVKPSGGDKPSEMETDGPKNEDGAPVEDAPPSSELAVPSEPLVLLKGRSTKREKVRTFSITLHGLLDYDEDDADEPTFELSLFAEAFHEMLMKDYGMAIFQALVQEREKRVQREKEREKEREEERRREKERKRRREDQDGDDKKAAKTGKEEPQEVVAVQPEGGAEAKEAGPEGQAKDQAQDVKQEDNSGEAAAATTGTDIVMVEAAVEEEAVVKEDGAGGPAKEDGAGGPAKEEGAGGLAKEEGTGGPAKEEPGPKVEDTAAKAHAASQDFKSAKESSVPPPPPPVSSGGDDKVQSTPEPDKEQRRDAEGKREEEPGKKKKKYKTDTLLLLAFRYYDRTGCGYIKPEDLRRLLHNLGLALPHRLVKELVAGVVDKRAERVYYRDIVDKEAKDEKKGDERGNEADGEVAAQ